MSGIIHFETFLLTSILLVMAPGNDTVFILTKSIRQGKKAGVISALGIGTGNIIYTILAALGLSIIIAKSPFLFNIIKYTGAVYLIYTGYKILIDKKQVNTGDISETKSIDYAKIYRAGIITNMLNPKAAIFFIAFIPQFIEPGLNNVTLPFLTLGIVFITTGLIWYSTLATSASVLFSKLNDNPKSSTYINKICGSTLLGFGVKIAFTNKI